MKRWSVAAALLAACLTGCTGETTATVNPQTQALERAEQAGLLREEEKKPQLLSVYEAQKLAGEQFDSESYAVAPSRETLECEVEGETHSFAVFDVSRRADGGAGTHRSSQSSTPKENRPPSKTRSPPTGTLWPQSVMLSGAEAPGSNQRFS